MRRGWSAAAIGVLLSAAAAAPPAPAPAPGLLLLRNGSVLHGRITHAGDRYIVTRGETAELRLPAREVEGVFGDLEQAYQFKRRSLPRGRAQAHLELAQWCLGQQLYWDAAEQLIAARRLDPDLPGADLLQRRLQCAAKSRSSPAAVSAPASSPTDEEVDQAIGRLSPGAVRDFTETIQPLLLNRCGAGGCHGGTRAGAFALRRPTWSDTITRPFTRHNLYSVLGQMDWQSPDSSPLLAIPAAPHGGLKKPIFDDNNADQYKQILAWLRHAAAAPEKEELSTIRRPDMLLLQAHGRTASSSGGPGGDRSSSPDAPIAVKGSDRRRPGPHEAGRAAKGSAAGPEAAAGQNAPPADPFDPELFNRRFLPPGT